MTYKNIEKKYGKIIKSGQSLVSEERVLIPVTPRIDIGLGGGIHEGSWVVFTGQPGAGKTSLALHFAATAQKKEYASSLCPEGRKVFVLSVEGRLKKRDLLGIPHLDISRVDIIESIPGTRPLYAAEFLSIAEMLIYEEPGSVIIIDSFSALSTEAEMTSGMDEMQRADAPKLISKFCRKTANLVPINKNIIIGITHLMGNPSGMGKAFKEKSGQSLAYQADVKLWANFFRPRS